MGRRLEVRRFAAMPETLTNPILLGTLLVPLGLSLFRRRAEDRGEEVDGNVWGDPERRRAPAPRLGALPIARRDFERLQRRAEPLTVAGALQRLTGFVVPEFRNLQADEGVGHRHVLHLEGGDDGVSLQLGALHVAELGRAP